ncbi:VOC family protein [Janthinobacterium sp. DSP2-3-3]|uniref:VOC family protein n=1 Tax=Janthinobacterium sp. DSP2-3-3 TaxID=2804596 RepID=UPI003CE6FA02
MHSVQKITPCLWFNGHAEVAARFYTQIFPNSKIGQILRYGEEGKEFHGQAPGSVLTVAFELDGQTFTGLNGGPLFQFSEAISFQVNCETQDEVDHYWTQLSEGGPPEAQQCSWLKDQFGVSWQIVPTIMIKLLTDPDPVKAQRVMKAMMGMKKINIGEIKRAYAG